MKINLDALQLAKVTRRDLVTKLATLYGALKANVTVSFLYDGKPRVVEVHAVGTSTKDGGLLLRGVQVGGQASRDLPAWTLYRVEGMEGLGLTFDASQAPREGYSQGDRQMTNLIFEIDV